MTYFKHRFADRIDETRIKLLKKYRSCSVTKTETKRTYLCLFFFNFFLLATIRLSDKLQKHTFSSPLLWKQTTFVLRNNQKPFASKLNSRHHRLKINSPKTRSSCFRSSSSFVHLGYSPHAIDVIRLH